MEYIIEITKALSDQNRLKAIIALNSRELCVCQIIELLELAPSTVSKHMSILKHAGLIKGRKDGRWMYYRLNNKSSKPIVRKILKWIFDSVKDDPQMENISDKLRLILMNDPEQLCKGQRK